MIDTSSSRQRGPDETDRMQTDDERLAEAAGALNICLDVHHTRKLMEGKRVKNGLEMKYNDIRNLVQANVLLYEYRKRKCNEFFILEHD